MKDYDLCDMYKEQLSVARKKYPALVSQVLKSQLARYVQCTCALENSSLPQWAVNKSIQGLVLEGFQQKDILLVQNQAKALRYAGKELLNKKLEVDDIKQLYDVMVQHLGEGKYCTENTIHLLGIVTNLINNNPSKLHPVKLSTYVYYLIIWIAPFQSHNGMLARLLANVVLRRAGYPIIIFNKYSDIMFKDLRHFSNIVETCVFESVVIYFPLLKQRMKALKMEVNKRNNMKRFTELLRRDDELADIK